MAPSKVTDSNFVAIWKEMNKKILRVRTIRAKLKVGQHIRISKDKMKFPKALNKSIVGKYFE